MDLKSIKGIGPKTLEKLHANQIYTAKDLLLTFPKKYYFYNVDNTNIFSGETVCFRCKVHTRPVVIKSMRNIKCFVFYILVNNERHKCLIFAGDYVRFKLYKEVEIICYGKYKVYEKEFLLTNIFFEDFECKVELDYGFYDINNSIISKGVKSILESGYEIEETLPSKYISKYRLLTMMNLINKVHFPENASDYIEVKRRTRYEDFFWYTSELEVLRISRGIEPKTPKIINEDILNDYIDLLPYKLTNDQQKALEQVVND